MPAYFSALVVCCQKVLAVESFSISSNVFPVLDRAAPLLAASCPVFLPYLPLPLSALDFFATVNLFFPCGPDDSLKFLFERESCVPCPRPPLGERDRTDCLTQSTSRRSCATSVLWTAADADGQRQQLHPVFSTSRYTDHQADWKENPFRTHSLIA